MTTAAEIKHIQDHGLYSPAHEHDACGVGFVAHIKGHKSHAIVQQGLKILENLDHRGAVGADALMGDGAGILIQLPDALYREEMAKQGVALPPPGEYGVGMVFLPKEHASRLACEQALERAVRAEGQVLLGWRDVPVNRHMPMSPTVRKKEPILKQIFTGAQAVCHPQNRKRRDSKPAPDAQQRILRAQHVQPHRGLQRSAVG
jgi:glutamate synthase (NADPH) large chain